MMSMNFWPMHFRHCAGGYLFEGDYEAFQRELATWEEE